MYTIDRNVQLSEERFQKHPQLFPRATGLYIRTMFFILFKNDLPLYIENNDCDMYADDSSVTSTVTTVRNLEKKGE